MANPEFPTHLGLAVGIGAFSAVAVVVLAITGRIGLDRLKQSHGWVLMGAFLIAAPLTESDNAPRMGVAATAIWLLYELGALVAMTTLKVKRR